MVRSRKKLRRGSREEGDEGKVRLVGGGCLEEREGGERMGPEDDGEGKVKQHNLFAACCYVISSRECAVMCECLCVKA
jgi:hypothetical protein